MISTILKAIAAIPELIKLIRDLLGWFEKVEREKWFAEKTEAMQAIEKAKTDEEFKEAAKKLNRVLRGL